MIVISKSLYGQKNNYSYHVDREKIKEHRSVYKTGNTVTINFDFIESSFSTRS